MFTLKIVGLLLKSTFEAKIHIDTSLTYKREKHIIIYMDEFNNSDSSIIIKAIKFSIFIKFQRGSNNMEDGPMDQKTISLFEAAGRPDGIVRVRKDEANHGPVWHTRRKQAKKRQERRLERLKNKARKRKTIKCKWESSYELWKPGASRKK